MRKILACLLTMMLVMLTPGHPHAGVDPNAAIPNASQFELIVLEADGCTYCDIFRRDVLPAYEVSEQGRDMPVRFVDINDVPAANLILDAPVDIVPTFIVVKASREVGRIPGYVGPENFFHSINYLMSTAP